MGPQGKAGTRVSIGPSSLNTFTALWPWARRGRGQDGGAEPDRCSLFPAACVQARATGAQWFTWRFMITTALRVSKHQDSEQQRGPVSWSPPVRDGAPEAAVTLS